MKALYFIALSLLIVSCKNQGKMDLEAAKTATVDSMGNGKAKSNRFHAGRNDKGRNPKGNYYNMNQPIIQPPPRQTHKRKVGVVRLRSNWCRCWCSYRSHYK
jgi:hypothetical protein